MNDVIDQKEAFFPIADLVVDLRNSLDAPEPACIVCRETDFGRGISCSIYFANRHLAVTELASPHGHKLRRESDRVRLQREVWQQFWRMLGAA